MSLYNFYRSDNWVNLLKVLKLQRVDDSGQIICEYCGKPIVRAYTTFIGHLPHKKAVDMIRIQFNNQA